MALSEAVIDAGAAVILADPIFQGLGIVLMAGTVLAKAVCFGGSGF
jgi:hypothetical protein